MLLKFIYISLKTYFEKIKFKKVQYLTIDSADLPHINIVLLKNFNNKNTFIVQFLN